MRTHAQIIAEADTSQLAELRGVSVHTVRSWGQRDSIPAEHWPDMVSNGMAQFDELLAGVKPRKQAPTQAEAA